MLSTGGLGFGNVNVGETSPPRTVLVSNSGSGTLSLNPPLFEGAGFNSTTNCPASLAPSASCSITVSFTPTAEGEASGKVSLTSSAGPGTVFLSGIGMVPLTAYISQDFDSVQPHSGQFATTQLGSSSTLTVFVLAKGNIELLNTNASLSGSPEFKFVAASRISPYYQAGAGMQYYSGDCNATVTDQLVTGCSAGPGYLAGPLFKHVALTLRYTPTAVGPATATLQVAHNGTNASPLVLNLTAQGLGVPLAALSTSSLTWSDTVSTTLVGSSTPQSVRLTNEGTATLALTAAPRIEGDAVFTASTGCGTSLAPGAFCDTTVTFAPTNTAAKSGQLIFSTNKGTPTVTLAGQGHTRTATLPDTNVGSALVGQSTTADVTLTNTGTLPLGITSPTASSVTGAGFSFVSSTCPTSLPVGQNCKVTVRFTASAEGSATGRLTMTTTAGSLASNLTAAGVLVFMDASGGTVTTSGNYRIHTFTSNGTFTVTRAPTTSDIEVLVVGGGGGGAGGGLNVGGGGGGAGGYIFTRPTVSSTGTVNVTVGTGGLGGAYNARGSSGTDSSISGVLGTFTAFGGGRGGTAPSSAASGGSGGGHSGAGGTPGSGTAGQGNNGAAGTGTYGSTASTGGGGGGANATAVGSAGGAGKSNTISGTTQTYAVGGNGGATSGGSAAARVGNTGNGGFGGNGTNAVGGAGAAGVVIIKYKFQ